MITTTAGRGAIAAAWANNTQLAVQDVQVSAANQSITPATTALGSVAKTITTVVGSVRAAGSGFALHVVLLDESADSYTIRALAVRLTSGVVLMAYAQGDALAVKASGSSLHFAFDLSIDAPTAATLTFGDTDYLLPLASNAAPGLIELATNAEVLAGTDGARAVTPAGLQHRLTNLTLPVQTVRVPVALPGCCIADNGSISWIGVSTGGMVSNNNTRLQSRLVTLDHIPDGASLLSVEVWCIPWGVRATGNRLIFQLWRHEPAGSDANDAILANILDSGAGLQQLVLTPAAPVPINKADGLVHVLVANSGTSGTDTIRGVFANYTLTQPFRR